MEIGQRKRWSLCRTGALQLDLDTTPEGFPVVLRAKCPSWQEVVVGLTWRLRRGHQLHACWAISLSYGYILLLLVCVCVFVRVFHEMIWVPLSLMKFKWQIPSRWLLYHLQGAPDVAIEVRIEMIHAFCVCVSLKYFHQGSPKNSLYTVYQIIPKVFSRWRGATSNISYNIIYKIIYICICKTNQGPLFNIPNSPGYNGPLWYCLVGNRLSFFGGDLWIQLPHVTRGLLTMEKMVSWSSAAKVKKRRLPECWKGVNWWGWKLTAHCSVCFKKITVDLVHKFWPFMEVHFQKFGPHRCFSERHVTMIQPWISQYGNLGTGMLG